MIADLENNRPPYAVLDSEFDDVHESNDSSKYSGVTLLDDYLRAHYGYAEHYGRFTVLERRAAGSDERKTKLRLVQ